MTRRTAQRWRVGLPGLALAVCAALASPVLAGPAPKFAHIGMEEGLPEPGVFTLLQDHLGFLWLGTQNGLLRYDGYRFASFKPEPDAPGSLRGRMVMALHEDREGTLWVGTRRGGLARFDRATETFEHFLPDPADPHSLSHHAVSAIAEDASGRLWVGTGDPESKSPGGGLNRFDPETGRFTRFRHDPQDPGSLASDQVTALLVDGAGVLWVGTAGAGLDRLDPGSDTFVHLPGAGEGDVPHHGTGVAVRYEPGLLPNGWVTSLAESEEGLWVGTYRGLVRLSPDRLEVTLFPHDPAVPGCMGQGAVSAVHADRSGRLWAGTWEGTLHLREPGSETFRSFVPDPDDPSSLGASSGITGILQDRTDIVWVATWNGSLDRLDPYAAKFPHFRHSPSDPDGLGSDRVSDLLQGRDGTIWIATRDAGLDRFDPGLDRFVHLRHDPDDPASLASDALVSLHEDREGYLWIGTAGAGLDRLDPRTGAIRHYGREQLGTDWILDVFEDRAGRVWVGTYAHGLLEVDRDNGYLVRRPGGEGGDGLDGVVRKILEDAEPGVLWLATDNGLGRYEVETGRLEVFLEPLSGLDIILGLHQDSTGRLWVGTFNGGLHRFDPATGTSTASTQRDGLAHDTVYGVVEADDGALWISTARGLSRLEPESGAFRSYGPRDGLQRRRLNGGAIKTRQGELLFGGETGINAFFPRYVKDRPHAPPVVLTGVRVFDREVEVGPGSLLPRAPSETREIAFSPDHDVFSLEFAALHFGHPQSNRYAYRLEPLDGDWHEVGHQRSVTFSHLPPGRYRLRVRAANADGVWNEAGTAVDLVVRPPWWRTWWAYGSYAGLLLVGFVSMDRVQRHRLVQRERERQRRQEAVLRAEAAELQAKAAEAQSRALQAEMERKTKELEDARHLQLSMLPERIPDHPRFAVAAFMRTATEVGGDYYDFAEGPGDALTVAIGDATGHGMRAGTMVTVVKSLFNLLGTEADLSHALASLGSVVRRLDFGNLLMAFDLVRFADGGLEAVGAGMPCLLVHRAAAGSVEEHALPGVPLGSRISGDFARLDVPLASGDTVLLMTDGLAELVGERGEGFGYERVRDAFHHAARAADPREVVHDLAAAGAAWAGGRPAADDVTMVVVRVR